MKKTLPARRGSWVRDRQNRDWGLLLARNRWPSLREHGVERLSRLKGRCAEEKVLLALIEASKDEEYGVRVSALRALLYVQDPRVSPLLCAALTANKGRLENSALNAIQKHKDPHALPALIKLMASTSSRSTRRKVRLIINTFDDALVLDASLSLFNERYIESDPIKSALELVKEHFCLEAVAPLCAFLRGEYAASVIHRRETVKLLGETASQSAVGTLLWILKIDPINEIRAAAAKALSFLHDERIFDALLKALNSSSKCLPPAAARAIGAQGDPRGNLHLIQALKSPSAALREAAAEALGRLRAMESFELLLGILRGDPSAEARTQAALALGELKIEGTLEGLCKALRDSNVKVQSAAAQALGMIRNLGAFDALKVAQDEASYLARKSIKEALDVLDEVRGTLQAVKILGASACSLQERCSAATRLGEVGDAKAFPSLCLALSKDPSPWVQREAAYALHKLSTRFPIDQGTLQALLRALSGLSEIWARRYVVRILAGSHGPSVRGALQDCARDDVEEVVRVEALGALGQQSLFFPKNLTLALQTLRSDEGALARRTAVELLASLVYLDPQRSSPEAGEALLSALSDEIVEVRRDAFHVLKRVGGEIFEEALERAEMDLNEEISRTARAWKRA